MLLARLASWISLRHFSGQFGRAAVSILGVALGVAVFVAIRLASGSAVTSFRESVSSLAGDANLQVSGRSQGLDERKIARLLAVPGVRRADPKIEAIATVSGKPGESVLVVGLDLFSDLRVQSALRAAARYGPADVLPMVTRRDAIAVSEPFAKRNGWKTGQTVWLSDAGRKLPFVIQMLLPEQGLLRAYGGDVAVMDIAAAQESFGQIGRVTGIDVVADEGRTFNRVRLEASRLFPGAEVARPASRGDQVESMIASFRLNLVALALVALFVGAFLIFNSVSLSVIQRRQEIGMARCIGVSRTQIALLFLGEALVCGVVGAFVGLGLGVGLSRLALGSVSATVSTMYAAVKTTQVFVDTPTLVWGLALGVVAALVSGLVPALEAASTRPGLAAREGSLIQGRRARLLWVSSGAVVSGLLAWRLALWSLEARDGLAGFASAGLVLVASSLAAPIVTVGLAWLARWPARKAGGIEGALAAGWIVQSLERTAVVIAALAAAVTMLIALNMMVGSFRRTVVVWMDQTIRADLFIEPASRLVTHVYSELPAGVVNTIRTMPGVRSWDTLRVNSVVIDGKQADLYAFDLRKMADNSRLLFLDGANTHQRVREALSRDEVLVSETFSNRFGKKRGDLLELATPTGMHRFRIAGVFYDYTTEAGLIVIHRPLYSRLWKDERVDTAAVYVKPGFTAESVRTELLRRIGGRYDIVVLPNRALKARALTIFDRTFAITNALKVVAVVIAVMGVITTMSTLILQRRRELGVMRAVGASRGQLARMAVMESGLIGIFGTVLGMACGPVLAMVLIQVINKLFFGWTIIPLLEAKWFFEAAVWVVAASLLAGLLPARFASRMQAAEAVRDES
ncbi:MAG: FtsX-like permease family protein [Armatimonadetes bacterium]|nr:FtsX-like permease family protein [Armatimonadota bacterium]